MGEDNLIYEDIISIRSWNRSIPFIILGIILMFILYFIMPFPVVTIYDSIYNIIFSISLGLVLVLVGVYFYFTYRKIRYAVTKLDIIIEYGREKKILPLKEITAIKRKSAMTFGEKLRASTENIEKVIFATIRDDDILKIYHNDILTAIITTADTEEFIAACDIKE